ncbi:MAG: DegQ family serine endoprotease [Thioalkalivibrionaceae bacterium]
MRVGQLNRGVWAGWLAASLVIAMFALMWPAPGSAEVRGLPDFTPLARDLSPSVVNISSARVASQARSSRSLPEVPGLPEGSLNELFERFFGEGMPSIPEHGRPGAPGRNSLGSGFVYRDDGYIVTNNHVVDGADRVTVTFSDRRVFEAEVVGTDVQSDLALLKIDATGLPALRLGSSDELQVGEWVLAIGSPFGFDLSVTAGIVSAKGRSLPNENYVPFIQTDVAINPGNSGGPLFNLKGEVVGVNSQIYSRTGGFMGLSFAIPVEMVRDVVEQLRTTGTVQRGWLGVLIQEVDRELADGFGMDFPTGALVAQVQPNSPAAAAGFQPGDVILSFNEMTISRSGALPPIVGSTPVGERVPVRILRGGREQTLQVVIEPLPEEMAALDRSSPQSSREAPTTGSEALGMRLESLSTEDAAALSLDEGALRITEVTGEPARSAGLRSGDVIVRIANQRTTSVSELQGLLSGLESGRSVPILIHRNGSPRFLAIRIP